VLGGLLKDDLSLHFYIHTQSATKDFYMLKLLKYFSYKNDTSTVILFITAKSDMNHILFQIFPEIIPLDLPSVFIKAK